jgi:hypothetical protein
MNQARIRNGVKSFQLFIIKMPSKLISLLKMLFSLKENFPVPLQRLFFLRSILFGQCTFSSCCCAACEGSGKNFQGLKPLFPPPLSTGSSVISVFSPAITSV